MSLIDPDYECQAHIKVDNEIGGPGVAASFLFVSWLTIILASILATHELKIAIKRFKTWLAGRKRARLKARSSSSSQSSPSDSAPAASTQHGDPETATYPLARETNHKETTADLSPKLHKVIQLLGHICDIQVVTALAIIVAGLAQWTRISYYHEIMVTQYFQLTLDSFWAARINCMDFYQIDHVHSGPSPRPHSPSNSNGDVRTNGSETTSERRVPEATYYDDRQPRLQVRRAAVLTACILAVIWQFRLYFRENVGPQHWNEGPDGPCYRYLDRSNPIAVLVVRTTGLIVFCFALVVTLLGFPWAGRLHRWYERGKTAAMDWARGRFMGSLGRCDALKTERTKVGAGTTGGAGGPITEKHTASTAQTTTDAQSGLFTGARPVQRVFATLMLTINGFILLVVFLLWQWLVIWSYGNGFYPLLWFCYFGFNVWNTISVISLLILNHPLVDHEEMDWGFGQVPPVVLLLAILFFTVDVFTSISNNASPQKSQQDGVTYIPIFCTAEVPVETLSEILHDAYYKGSEALGIEPCESLILVHDKNTLPSAREHKFVKKLEATLPPVSDPPTSDFHGATIGQLMAHVQENTESRRLQQIITGTCFLVADNQTLKDKSLNLVDCHRDFDGSCESDVHFPSVRVASDQADILAVNVEIANVGVGELKDNADEDGVCRG
ncbi:hypothetical protein V8F06_010767 [Rhypophila decipiens]